MTSYKILNLNNQTTQVARARLGTELRAVPGVNVVTISAERGEISLSFRSNTAVANRRARIRDRNGRLRAGPETESLEPLTWRQLVAAVRCGATGSTT
jgi:hypothetical protein